MVTFGGEPTRGRDSVLDAPTAESVIEQLRAQLRIQGTVPKLPSGWHVDVEQRAANRAPMAGDFVSSRLHDVGGNLHLDLVLVDVSGKGVEAGTRALLLSGAMGGLLGAVGPSDFLNEANDYLLRQAWPEGFASAVYIRVTLETGLYSVRSAGHPPALHLESKAEAWRISDSRGPVLGVLPTVSVRADYKTMRPGDALLLYTDGVVEDPAHDISFGTQRLMSEAEAAVRSGSLQKVAADLVTQVPTRDDDDRAVVMVWRDPKPQVFDPADGTV
jgi:serine phosphatase RsbU (regulator of sigma subunit)